MPARLPHVSTDQMAAFVELARQGRIRPAAQVLGITEQGLRNRLIALEQQLGVELYLKRRGPRRSTVITEQGQRFLPHARAFLERAQELYQALQLRAAGQEIHVVASQYLVRYVLIDVLSAFRAEAPHIQVRASTMTEREVEEALLRDAGVAFGVVAPYERSLELEYHELFAMDWSVIVPRGHALAGSRRVRLAALLNQPLILYERGSTGRQHILDAFHEQGLSPRVALETTSTETIVTMVEAGLGVAIVPLLPNGAVTRRRDVDVVALRDPIRAIHSGVLVRRGERLSEPSARLLAFTRSLFTGA